MIRQALLMLMIVFWPVLVWGVGDALYIPDLGSSARMIGIGNIEGMDDTSNSIFENPAALYRVSDIGLSVFTTKLFDEVTYLNLTAAKKTSVGTFAFGYMSVGVDDIAHTTKNAQNRFEVARKFNFQNFVAKLGYQNTLWTDVYYGLTLNYYTNNVGNFARGSGYNMDSGILWDTNRVDVSLTLKNIIMNSKLDYEGGRVEEIPFQTVLGASWDVFSDFSLYSQIKTSTSLSDPLLSAGLSYNPFWLHFFSVYIGAKQFPTEGKVDSHYTFGLGIKVGGLSMNYTYEKSDVIDTDSNNYFSISLNL